MTQFEVGEKGNKKHYAIESCHVDTATRKRKCVMCEDIIIPKSKCVKMQLTGLRYNTPNSSLRSACVSCGRDVLQSKEHDAYERAERLLNTAAEYRASLKELNDVIRRDDLKLVKSLKLGKDGKYRPKEK